MTKLNIWIQGARPKTLGAAIAPVLVGSSIAFYENSFNLLITFLCLIVGISIQIGVNYANDYSDGIRGTDNQRVGPVRLVGQKLASAKSVKSAAIIFFFIASVSGLLVSFYSKQWWFLLIGLSAIISAWTYTGGPKPYGYAGFGELFVFIYFVQSNMIIETKIHIISFITDLMKTYPKINHQSILLNPLKQYLKYTK